MDEVKKIDEVKKLKEEFEKVRSQLYVFYELTKAMRTTLRLEEITYTILTCLTAHEGLAYNRAVIFFADEDNKNINGFMGVGPIDAQEASEIWRHIEKEKKDVYALIDNYREIKKENLKPKFMKFIQSLSFPLNKESGLIFNAFYQKDTLYIKKNSTEKFKDDPLVQKLNLEEFLIRSLWIKGKPTGLVVVDNYITAKPITDDNFEIFNMFMEQATRALENSQSFESTLTKAHTDSLTLLWNYGYFQYKLDEELARADTMQLPLSVMIIDLDDFKLFNDSYGHIQGDNALRRISEILKENCRKVDIVCRYGGEEFSIILPANNKEDARLLGERIRKSIEENKIFGSRFTVSIGIAAYPQDSLDKITLIKKADSALYEAKRTGKNRVILA